MAGSSFADVCRFNPTAGGTTAWTYSSAVQGYQSPAAAGLVNGAQYSYRAESADLTQWENGQGIWNSSTGVLTRAKVISNSSGTGTGTGQSGAGTLINFTAAPQVAIVALAEDLTVTNAAAKSDQQAASSSVLAVTPLHQQDHPSAAKAFANVSAAGVLQSGFNIASVSRVSAGVFNINFTVPFSNANYVPQVTSIGTSGGIIATILSPTTSGLQVVMISTSGNATDPASGFSFTAYGSQ